MERTEFETILGTQLAPIHRAIDKLEESQEQIVEILQNQARQDESIKHIREDLTICVKDRDELFTLVREHEQEDHNKVWGVLKVVVAALLAFLFGRLV